jgi:hypothetical protein
MASIRYFSHLLSVYKASTRVSRASYWSWYQSARSSVHRGSYASPELGPLAPVTSKQGKGEAESEEAQVRER